MLQPGQRHDRTGVDPLLEEASYRTDIAESFRLPTGIALVTRPLSD
jgi:hypothetical protein